MEISIQELLNCEYFSKSRILAGHGGIGNIITSVTVLDSPDAHHYFSGGELVLTTGYSFLNDFEYQKRIIRTMVEKGVSGLAIQLRFYNYALPEVMAEEAERLNFPIIELPLGNPYTKIVNFITNNLLSKTTKEIKSLTDVYREINESMYRNGYQGIADILYKWTGMETIISFDEKIYIGPIDWKPPEFPLDPDEWKKKILGDYHTGDIDCYYWRKKDVYLEWICSRMTLNSENEGYLILLRKEKYIAREVFLLLDYCSMLIVMMGRNEMRITQIKRRQKYDFIKRLLDSQTAPVDIQRQAAFLEYELYPEGVAVLLENAGEAVFESICKKYFSANILGCAMDGNNSFLYLKRENLAQTLEKICREYGVTAAMGMPADLVNIGRSYGEARRALEISKYIKNDNNVYDYSQMGFYRFFCNPSVEGDLTKYCQELLQPLKNIEGESYKVMLDTINAFINNRYSFRETAEQLYVHPNTVRYRISHVEKQCNISFKDANDRLNMEIAMKLLPFI